MVARIAGWLLYTLFWLLLMFAPIYYVSSTGVRLSPLWNNLLLTWELFCLLPGPLLLAVVWLHSKQRAIAEQIRRNETN